MPISKKILGIDPGTAATGFGLIEIQRSQLKIVDAGVIKTKSSLSLDKRLVIIHQQLDKLIKKHRPQIASVEQLFFCRNTKTAIAVGMARGVILLTCAQNKVELEEYTPLQVKQALTGYGQATKRQIQLMVKSRLKLKNIPRPDDLSDALAIAICSSQTKKYLKND